MAIDGLVLATVKEDRQLLYEVAPGTNEHVRVAVRVVEVRRRKGAVVGAVVQVDQILALPAAMWELYNGKGGLVFRPPLANLFEMPAIKAG